MVEIDEITARSYYQLFYANFQNKNDQQFANMCSASKNYCKCFQKTEKYLEELHKIYWNPIKFAIEKDLKVFGKRSERLKYINVCLSRLDWIYFRDTLVRSKLKLSYGVDASKLNRRKREEFYLEDIIDVLAVLKDRMCEIVTEVSIENQIKIDLQFPTLESKPLESVGIEESRRIH